MVIVVTEFKQHSVGKQEAESNIRCREGELEELEVSEASLKEEVIFDQRLKER